MPKNVLFISYDGMTDPLGQSQVIPYLQGLSKQGYTIFLLSCEKPAVFKEKKGRILKLLQGYDIKWHPIQYTKKPAVLSTVWDVMKMKRTAAKLHRKYRIDMVHTRPGIPALIGLWMKEKFKIKFLNDIREFYADSRTEGGIWDLENRLYRVIYNYFRKKEEKAVKLNDGIVCLTHAAEKVIKMWDNYSVETPIEVIPCSVDLQLFNPDRVDEKLKARYRSELNLKCDDIVVSYLGSVGGWYLTDEMLDFCRQMISKVPAVKFLFISPHKHQFILEKASNYDIPADKIIVRSGNREEVPVLLSLSSYSLFFIKPCYSKISSSPTKHGEIMAMGIPVITNSGVGDVAEIVRRHQSGVVINEFNESAYHAAISSVLENKNYTASQIRQGAAEFYSLDSAIEKYSNMYRRILN
jgi:glycosyltransferase involved in cell wall biosynthesis